MADELQGQAPGTPPPSQNPPTMASTNGGGQPQNHAASPSAAQSSVKFGGLPSGRKRLDGFKPGSPEALAADREKERLKKQAQRAAKKAMADPAPLPSSGSGPQTPSGGLVDSQPVAAAPAIPWEPGVLKPIFDQLLPTLETLAIKNIESKAVKARIPEVVIGEIKRDAAWPEPAKVAISISGPQVAANLLNKTGISAEHQAEVVLLTAIGSIFASHMMINSRLDKIIAQNGPPAPIRAEQPAKPAEKPQNG